MGGRENNGRGLARVRWLGAGVLGLGLLVQSCGKTAQSRHGEGVAGSVAVGGEYDDPAPGDGGGPSVAVTHGVGGSNTVAGSLSVGGAAGAAGEAGTAGEAGAGGAPTELRRPITAHIVDHVTGGMEGIKLYIAGETFVSDADGVVHATAPFGAYDAYVLDTGIPAPPRDGGSSGIHIYEGLTTSEPVFTLFYDYADQDEPQSSATGSLLGTYPDGLTTFMSFDTPSPKFIGASGKVVNGAYTATGTWLFSNASAYGTLMALLWSADADQHATAFWYGQTELTWGANIDLSTDINVAALASRSLKLQLELPPGTIGAAYLSSGPFTLANGSSDSINGQTFLVPKAPLPNPSLSPKLKLYYNDLTTGTAAAITANAPAAGDTLSLSAPQPPRLLAPAEGAKKIAATTVFSFEALPDTCHEVYLNPSGYNVTIHTVRHELTPPDLTPFGVDWPAAAFGTWTVFSAGPCSSIDQVVTATPATLDPSSRFVLGSHTFTTAH